MIDPDLGVEMQVFSTCRHCGDPISRQLDEVTPSMDAWVDVTEGDACSAATVHEPTVVPDMDTLLRMTEDVQITMAKRVRKGAQVRFLQEHPDDSGRWFVHYQGQNIAVWPHQVEGDY